MPMEDCKCYTGSQEWPKRRAIKLSAYLAHKHSVHYRNKTLDTILYNKNHGFIRSGVGRETQLCATYRHDIAKAVDRGSVVHKVILDFQGFQDFDKVLRCLLMQKIEGISCKITNWIQGFLTNRSQRIAVRGALSTELPVSSVSQGSVLGPTLFLIYINDLSRAVSCNVSLYADDTLLYYDVNSKQEKQLFQMNINALHNWSTKWKMPFNTNKYKIIAFNNKTQADSMYPFGGNSLRYVQEARYLGI